ncbi:MAG: hypothetical protein RMI63_08880 [Caldimicrobium sp.]|nr:hypothetical protein [Caldimicrobium sp.]MDW8095115.1 hypothetical protein [Caldimicrobium sp.]
MALPKIAIYTGSPINLSRDIACLITFQRNFPKDEYTSKRACIYVDQHQGFRRIYQNFKLMPPHLATRLYKSYLNRSFLQGELLKSILLALNYRYKKLDYRTKLIPKKPSLLMHEASTIIKAYYHYYSTACAILTALFLTRIGIPSEQPKLLEQVYGFDFMDDLFLPIAFLYTVFESVKDLLLGEAQRDPVYMAKSFISFLLWRGCKPLLKIPYYRLILGGAKGEDIWIIL